MGKNSALCDYINSIKVIDTHEHLWDESYRLKNPGDWAALFWHYGSVSLEVSGMSDSESAELFSPNTLHDAKWSIFSKYFPLAKNTAYIKAALISIKEIYGIDEITSESMLALSAKIKEAVKPGFHRAILRDKAGIDYCMNNSFDRDEHGARYPARLWGDTELIRPDLYVDYMMYPQKDLLARETGVDCSDLSGFEKAIDVYFEKNAHKCCSMKLGVAYFGDLNFQPDVPRRLAEELYKSYSGEQPPREFRPLADYLFFKIVQKSAEYHLSLKFHTGLYCNGVDFDAMRNNVRDLAVLAGRHPECNFIAMHIAYPHSDELIVAARQVRNFYADMTWAWIFDPEGAADFLKRAIVAAPINKIMGFGGDYSLVENVCGHLVLARRGISKVLSELMDDGYLDLDEACGIGRALLRESAEKLYKR